MTFSEKLIRLRKIKGITQDDFAAIVGVSRQAVYKWESGKSYPEVPKMIEIKNLFNVSIDDLLDENFVIEMPKKKRKKRLSAEKKREIEMKVERELYDPQPEVSETPAVETVAAEAEKTIEEVKVEEPVVVAAPVEEKVEAAAPAEEKDKKVGFFGRLFGRK